ncbi:MAG: molybdopterin-binding protein [Ardenticatenaceae bacterium]|nr:molybdopterin-binding protein [Ardenticatenaceae bacterium]
MKFGPVPLNQAEGKILGHNITGPDGRRLFRKGRPLTVDDINQLRELGRDVVYVATLNPDDISENAAALRIATAAAGQHLRVSKPTTGRANLFAKQLGLLRIDQERLMQVNLCEGVTLGTLPNHAVVPAGKMVATLKIISYALPPNIVREAESLCTFPAVNSHNQAPLIHIDPLLPRKVGLILSGSPPSREKVVSSFEKAMMGRLSYWGSTLEQTDFIPLEDEEGEIQLAHKINEQISAGIDVIILAGETAIMDRYDLAPRAVEQAGGRITVFGAPVDPGNLLMLARHDRSGRMVHIIGAPGCARSPKHNIVDLVLPRLLAGDYLTKMDIVKLAMGGMLEDVPERGRPRKLN